MENEKCFQSLLIAESDGQVELERQLADSKESGPLAQKAASFTEITLQGRENGQFSANEKIVGQVWGEILGYQTLSIHNDLYQLGGDSIIAMKIANNINNRLNLDLTVSDLLQFQTIQQLAVYIDTKFGAQNFMDELVPLPESPYYHLSSAQMRIFFAARFDSSKSAYNLPTVMIIEGALKKSKMEKAFRDLFQRHEILRTSFKLVDAEPVQIVHPEVDFRISELEATEGDLKNILTGFNQQFALDQAPLLRVSLVTLGLERYALIFNMHHIITDGTSIGIMIREVIDLYEGKPLKDLRVQYKDFAAWQNKLLDAAYLNKSGSLLAEPICG